MSAVTLVRAPESRRGSDRAETASDGEYELLDLLGRGGMATVYLARHRASGRKVALKLVTARHLEDLPRRTSAAIQRRLLREARAVSAIRHPNVVEFLDAGVMDGSVFIVMEHLEGCSLSDALDGDAALAWPEVATIGAQIAAGVAAAHAAGIIHRDLKPGNVMLLPREPRVVAKVFDFGIAKLLESAHGLTLPGTTLGTPRYMSPEQCRGDERDHRTDIYSLGVVLYRALTGRCPFEHTDGSEVMRMHEEAPVPPLPVDGLPDAFARLVTRCLAKHPDERPATMHEVALALDALRPGGRSSRVPLPPPPAPVASGTGPAPIAPVAPAALDAFTPPPLLVPTVAVTPLPPPTRRVTRFDPTRVKPWLVRASAGATAIAIALLAWWMITPEPSPRALPPLTLVVPAPLLAAPATVTPLVAPADVAHLAGLAACYGRVEAVVEGRRGRPRPWRTAMTFVARCLDRTD